MYLVKFLFCEVVHGCLTGTTTPKTEPEEAKVEF